MFEAMNLYCNKSGRHVLTLGDRITYTGELDGLPIESLAGLSFMMDENLKEFNFFKELPNEASSFIQQTTKNLEEYIEQKNNKLIIKLNHFKLELPNPNEQSLTKDYLLTYLNKDFESLIIDYQYYKLFLAKNQEPFVTYNDHKIKIIRGEHVNASVFYKREEDLTLAKGLLGVFDEPVNKDGKVNRINLEKINELYQTYMIYCNHKVNNRH